MPTTTKAPVFQPASQMADLPLSAIAPSGVNPRERFDEDALRELTESIRTYGLIEPIIVRPDPGVPDAYIIIAGERRWKAAIQAELETVPVVIRDLPDEDALVLQVIENVQREDLDPIEVARGYAQLLELTSMTQSGIAAAVGKNQSQVAHALRLLRLPEKTQERLRNGSLRSAHGKALARFAEYPKLVDELARMAVELGWSAKELERGFPGGALYQLQEKKLVTQLGVGVPTAAREELERAGLLYLGSWTWDIPALQRAYDKAKAEDAERTAAALEASKLAAAASGTDFSGENMTAAVLPSLADLPAATPVSHLDYGDREMHTPESPCHAQALAQSGELVDVYTDPASHKSVRRRETIDRNKQTRARAARVREAVAERIAHDTFSDVPQYGSAHDALALICEAALSTCRSSVAREEAVKAINVNTDLIGSYGSINKTAAREMGSRALVRMTLAALLVDEQHFAELQPAVPDDSAWYVRELIPTQEEDAELTRLEELAAEEERERTHTPDEVDLALTAALARDKEEQARLQAAVEPVETPAPVEPTVEQMASRDWARRKAWSYLRRGGYSITKSGRGLADVEDGELLHILGSRTEAEPKYDWPVILAGLRISAGA